MNVIEKRETKLTQLNAGNALLDIIKIAVELVLKNKSSHRI